MADGCCCEGLASLHQHRVWNTLPTEISPTFLIIFHASDMLHDVSGGARIISWGMPHQHFRGRLEEQASTSQCSVMDVSWLALDGLQLEHENRSGVTVYGLVLSYTSQATQHKAFFLTECSGGPRWAGP
jgi:hypothetical protein